MKRIGILVDKRTYDLLKEYAKQSRRTVTSIVTEILEHELNGEDDYEVLF